MELTTHSPILGNVSNGTCIEVQVECLMAKVLLRFSVKLRYVDCYISYTYIICWVRNWYTLHFNSLYLLLLFSKQLYTSTTIQCLSWCVRERKWICKSSTDPLGCSTHRYESPARLLWSELRSTRTTDAPCLRWTHPAYFVFSGSATVQWNHGSSIATMPWNLSHIWKADFHWVMWRFYGKYYEPTGKKRRVQRAFKIFYCLELLWSCFILPECINYWGVWKFIFVHKSLQSWSPRYIYTRTSSFVTVAYIFLCFAAQILGKESFFRYILRMCVTIIIVLSYANASFCV